MNLRVSFSTGVGVARPRNDMDFSMHHSPVTASSDQDYSSFASSLTVVAADWIASGAAFTATPTLSVQTLQDTVYEGSETFNATLTSSLLFLPTCPPGTQLGASCVSEVTIVDDDTLGVQGVAVTSTPTGGYYDATNTISFTVNFNGAVTVTNTPRFAFELGGQTRHANYASGSDSTDLVFSYTVANGDDDQDGISWGANALDLSGGSVKFMHLDAAERVDANLGHAAQGDLSAHKVDTTKPSVASASADGTALMLTFSEDLNTTAPANSVFTVKVDGGTGANPTGVSISGSVVTLTLGTPGTPGQTVTVTYTKPTMNPIKDLSGKEADAFTDQGVTTTPAVAVTVTFAQNSYTAAEGATESVTVRLSDNPLRRVIIPIVATKQGASTADYSFPESVTFISGETIKTLDFMAADDPEDDDGESVGLAFGTLPEAVSPGAHPQTTVNITDDDSPPGVQVTPEALSIPEGESKTYTIVLTNAPTALVMVAVMSDNSDVTVDNASLTFTTSDWNRAQTVTVMAGEDTDSTNDTATISHTVTSGDTRYNGISASAVRVAVVEESATRTTGSSGSSTGGGGGGGGSSNRAPTITGPRSLQYPEHSTEPVATYEAVDPEGTEISWQIEDSDSEHFRITEDGVLHFITPLDYENPVDFRLNNTYEIRILAVDSGIPSQSGGLNVQIEIKRVNELGNL